MDGVQKRPLTGMILVANGTAAPRLVGNGVAVIAHTIDNSTTQITGPFLDMVTLWVANATNGVLTLTVIVAGGTPIVLILAANSLTKVFDDAPFQNAVGAAAATITVQGSAVGLVFWGDHAVVL